MPIYHLYFNLFTLQCYPKQNFINSRLKHDMIKNSFTRCVNREMERKRTYVYKFTLTIPELIVIAFQTLAALK